MTKPRTVPRAQLEAMAQNDWEGFFIAFLDHAGIMIHPNHSITQHNKNLSLSGLELQLTNAFEDTARALATFKRKPRSQLGLNYSKINTHLVGLFIDNYKATNRENQRLVLLKEIAHRPNLNFEELIYPLFERVLTTVDDVEIAALKQVMWQVKRKLIGKDPTHHLMIVVLGKQGTGKTSFIKYLTEPLATFRGNASLEELLDPRTAGPWVDNYINICDELQDVRGSRELTRLKSCITSSEIEYRKMGTNITSCSRNTLTLFGSTNKPLAEVINDPTGARRFHQFSWRVTPEELLGETGKLIETFDYLQLWRAVDEYQEAAPTKQFLSKLSVKQEANRSNNSLEEFIEYNGYVAHPTKRVSVMDLYNEYQSFVRGGGGVPKGRNLFKQEFQRLVGCEVVKPNNKYMFCITKQMIDPKDPNTKQLKE